MARRESSDKNILDLHDNLSNTDIRFYYRTPTTTERNGYNNFSIQRKRNTIKVNAVNARLKYGLQIITGIREGDFERMVGESYVSVASDPASKNYHEDWKGWLELHAADLVMLLAGFVFDASVEIDRDTDDDAEEEDEDAEGNSQRTSTPSSEVSAA
jgi:hypothetical protein